MSLRRLGPLLFVLYSAYPTSILFVFAGKLTSNKIAKRSVVSIEVGSAGTSSFNHKVVLEMTRRQSVATDLPGTCRGKDRVFSSHASANFSY